MATRKILRKARVRLIVKDRGDPLAISERLRASRCPVEQWEPPVQESISTAFFLSYRFLASPDEEGPSSPPFRYLFRIMH